MRTGQHLEAPTIDDRVRVCKTHLNASIQWKGPVLGIIEMRRHYTNYFKGIPHFKDYRMKLVTLNSYDEILAVLDDIREQFSNLPLINS
jgi:tRNA-dihydrouridine synthase